MDSTKFDAFGHVIREKVDSMVKEAAKEQVAAARIYALVIPFESRSAAEDIRAMLEDETNMTVDLATPTMGEYIRWPIIEHGSDRLKARKAEDVKP